MVRTPSSCLQYHMPLPALLCGYLLVVSLHGTHHPLLLQAFLTGKSLHIKAWNQPQWIVNTTKHESESHTVVSDSLWPHGLYSPWNSPGQNTGLGILSPFQGIFPIQGLNPGLLRCRRILYQLSYQGSLIQNMANTNSGLNLLFCWLFKTRS